MLVTAGSFTILPTVAKSNDVVVKVILDWLKWFFAALAAILAFVLKEVVGLVRLIVALVVLVGLILIVTGVERYRAKRAVVASIFLLLVAEVILRALNIE